MDEDAFHRLVVETLDSLPAEVQRQLDLVAVQIAHKPSRAQRAGLRMRPWEQLYGLYEGVPLPERGGDAPLLPDSITIFRLPLTRDFRAPDELRMQIRRTVLHELAHFFGIDDDRLRVIDAY